MKRGKSSRFGQLSINPNATPTDGNTPSVSAKVVGFQSSKAPSFSGGVSGGGGGSSGISSKSLNPKTPAGAGSESKTSKAAMQTPKGLHKSASMSAVPLPGSVASASASAGASASGVPSLASSVSSDNLLLPTTTTAAAAGEEGSVDFCGAAMGRTGSSNKFAAGTGTGAGAAASKAAKEPRTPAGGGGGGTKGSPTLRTPKPSSSMSLATPAPAVGGQAAGLSAIGAQGSSNNMRLGGISEDLAEQHSTSVSAGERVGGTTSGVGGGGMLDSRLPQAKINEKLFKRIKSNKLGGAESRVVSNKQLTLSSLSLFCFVFSITCANHFVFCIMLHYRCCLMRRAD
jgi:hypothetical protein